MIKLLHLSDIHMGSGFSHGRLNPETGLNTRLEDFDKALQTCINRAIAESVDLVLFGGDAFPDATPPPYVQQILAQQFCRLAEANIPTVLLVGNHDQHAQGQGGASLSIYRTLGVPRVIVGDRLETHQITTASGPVQVVTLPWLTRSTLLTRPDSEGRSMAQINEILLNRLRTALEGEIRRLNPAIPTILLAHAMVDTAAYGAERFLAAGRGFTIPMALLARDCFDYVALGHVHRHQILCQQPLMIYPGSIERVDFSEAQEEKGYMLVQVERGAAKAEFCPLPVRPFRTINVDLTQVTDPQATLLAAIANADINDAVVRCFYTLRSDQLTDLDQTTIETALTVAHTYSLQPDIQRPTVRPQLGELSAIQGLDPTAVLQAYLADRDDLADIAEAMVRVTQDLLASTDLADLPIETYSDQHYQLVETDADRAQQLRLL